MLKRIAIKWLVLAAAAGVLLAALGWFGLGLRPGAGRPGGRLTLASSPTCSASGATFCVSSPTPGPVLLPGAAPSSLPVTFSNPISVPVYVDSLTVSLKNTFPSGCLPSWFKVSGVAVAGSTPSATITFATPMAIAAGSTASPGTASYAATLALVDAAQNQNTCKNLPLTLSYNATAQYTLPTTTSLQTSPGPSTDGQTVKLTATVGANVTPTGAGATPVGTVTFYKCSGSAASSCTTSLGSAALSAGTASISTSFTPTGTYYVEAVYSPTDSTSFSASSSTVQTQTVGGCATAATTGAKTVITGSYNGNLTIASGGSVWLNGGTINGNVTIASGGQFAATGGTINGNIQSTGGPVSLAGTTMHGNVQTQGTGLYLAPGTTVSGNVSPEGGPFCSDGISPSQSPVKISGNLAAQALTSTAQSSICGTVVSGNLVWQSNASPVLLGSCGANTIGGNLQVQSNTGTVTVAQDSANGNIQIQSNTGGGTLTGSSAGGNCQLQSDKPGIVGSGNTARGSNSCNTGTGGA